MIIGVVGATSNIASKAYLPVYAALQDEHRFVLYSRTWEKAEAVRKRYKFEYATTDLEALATCELVIIHAATSEHFALAKHFLSAGVAVLMDKPISEHLAEVQELLDLAQAKNVLFVVGFNRRFAPLTARLKAVPNKNFVKVTKNLIEGRGEASFKLYDVFIHPLDTLIYLLDEPILSEHYSVRFDRKGQLIRASVLVETASTSGLATCNLTAGAYAEEFAVESEAGTYKLNDLSELSEQVGIDRTHFGSNGWAPATQKRGFDALVKGMIAAVTAFDGSNRAALLADMKQEKILLAHEIIQRMLDSTTKEKN